MSVMFTVYNEVENKYQLVEEPDPSLRYTYADYLQWKFEERVELFRGRIFKMSPAPNSKHQQVSLALSTELYSFFKGKPCKVFAAPFDVRGCCGAPDLVVEILSPGNSKRELKIKFDLYEEAGVKEYWIVYPVEESIAVFLLNENGKFGGAKIYAGGDYIFSAALNGLKININDTFAN